MRRFSRCSGTADRRRAKNGPLLRQPVAVVHGWRASVLCDDCGALVLRPDRTRSTKCISRTGTVAMSHLRWHFSPPPRPISWVSFSWFRLYQREPLMDRFGPQDKQSRPLASYPVGHWSQEPVPLPREPHLPVTPEIRSQASAPCHGMSGFVMPDISSKPGCVVRPRYKDSVGLDGSLPNWLTLTGSFSLAASNEILTSVGLNTLDEWNTAQYPRMIERRITPLDSRPPAHATPRCGEPGPHMVKPRPGLTVGVGLSVSRRISLPRNRAPAPPSVSSAKELCPCPTVPPRAF